MTIKTLLGAVVFSLFMATPVMAAAVKVTFSLLGPLSVFGNSFFVFHGFGDFSTTTGRGTSKATISIGRRLGPLPEPVRGRHI